MLRAANSSTNNKTISPCKKQYITLDSMSTRTSSPANQKIGSKGTSLRSLRLNRSLDFFSYVAASSSVARLISLFDLLRIRYTYFNSSSFRYIVEWSNLHIPAWEHLCIEKQNPPTRRLTIFEIIADPSHAIEISFALESLIADLHKGLRNRCDKIGMGYSLTQLEAEGKSFYRIPSFVANLHLRSRRQ